MFDLATVAEHHCFDRARSDVLLAAYFGAIREEDVCRMNSYRSLYRHLLILWLTTVEQLCGISAEEEARLRKAWNRINECGSF